MPTVLAIDQSTSATKALLYDEKGTVLHRESRPHRQYYPQPGWVEHDADEIWRNVLEVVHAVLAHARNNHQFPLCLSITNQRETVVVFERHTGRPLMHALVWQDRRGDSLCAQQAEAGRESTIHKKTGLKLDAYFSGSKLQWLVRETPELKEKLNTGKALIGTIDTYLIYRFTEGRVFATDHTNASRTLLFDLTKLDWDDELCRWWEIPRHALPEVRPSTGHFGETTLEGSLSTALPICGVMGDSQASLFAQRGFLAGDAKVTFGTGSSILLNVGPSPKFFENGVVTTLAWVHDEVPTYTLEGIVISSASTLTWLIDQLGMMKDAAEIEKLASSVSYNESVYLVPAFSGLGLPHWRPDARAAIVGLTSHTDRRHIARAALESMAYQLRDVLDTLRNEADLDPRVIHADGGPTANRMLMQFAADITGIDLHVSVAPDCSSLGAALAGLLGCGIHKTLRGLAALPRSEIIYRPSMPAAEVARNWSGWQQAIRQVIPAENPAGAVAATRPPRRTVTAAPKLVVPTAGV